MRDAAVWRFVRMLGPGLLFAGAAIGVSHLVQSTRAGAVAGLSLIPFIVLANLSKYPALAFGPRYTTATGLSLLEGYRRQGRITLVVFGLMTTVTMFAVVAAITLVNASLLQAMVVRPLLGEVPLLATCAAVIVACAALLAVGGFAWLDWLMKGLLGLMAVLTAVATVLAVLRMDWSMPTLFRLTDEQGSLVVSMAFLFALAGWMPAPIDIAVWNSLWSLAHEDETRARATRRSSAIDFHVGFVLCVMLAVCFTILGAAVMHGRGLTFSDQATVFATEIVDLFVECIGPWSRPLIGAAAIGVMTSTILTVIDAYPRVLVVLVQRLRSEEQPGAERLDLARSAGYWIWFVIVAAGALLILGTFLGRLKLLVDIATTATVITAPILAWFNHRAIVGPEVPADHRPGATMLMASRTCIALLSVLAVGCAWSLLR